MCTRENERECVRAPMWMGVCVRARVTVHSDVNNEGSFLEHVDLLHRGETREEMAKTFKDRRKKKRKKKKKL